LPTPRRRPGCSSVFAPIRRPRRRCGPVRRRGKAGRGDRIIPELEPAGRAPETVLPPDELLGLVKRSLDDDKALDLAVIDLEGKTSIADYMVVATGTSQRHVAAMATKLMERLKEAGHHHVLAEGLEDPAATWVLIDTGDVLVHLFRAETRAFYDIEKLWSVAPPKRAAAAPG
jgi:ribosome-associated protein